MIQQLVCFTLNLFTLKKKANKILSLFTTKGKQKVNPFDFLEQYCRVKMALLIEIIFISKLQFLFRSKYTRSTLNHLNQENQYPLQRAKEAIQKIMTNLKILIYPRWEKSAKSRPQNVSKVCLKICVECYKYLINYRRK